MAFSSLKTSLNRVCSFVISNKAFITHLASQRVLMLVHSDDAMMLSGIISSSWCTH